MQTAEHLIPASPEPVKHGLHACSLCGFSAPAEFAYCYSCDRVPGISLAHKRAVIQMIADHQQECDERRKREAALWSKALEPLEDTWADDTGRDRLIIVPDHDTNAGGQGTTVYDVRPA